LVEGVVLKKISKKRASFTEKFYMKISTSNLLQEVPEINR